MNAVGGGEGREGKRYCTAWNMITKYTTRTRTQHAPSLSLSLSPSHFLCMPCFAGVCVCPAPSLSVVVDPLGERNLSFLAQKSPRRGGVGGPESRVLRRLLAPLNEATGPLAG